MKPKLVLTGRVFKDIGIILDMANDKDRPFIKIRETAYVERDRWGLWIEGRMYEYRVQYKTDTKAQ